MEARQSSVKKTLLEVLDSLPPDRQAEILDFALFLKQRMSGRQTMASRVVVKGVPAESFKRLAGLVSWGGDAVEDAERLYDE